MTQEQTQEHPPLMLSALILVCVDREDGVPSVSLDKIKDYLTEAVRLDIDREGVGELDDDHSVTALSIEWDTLQHGIIGESNWECPECGDSVTVKNRELETIGTPMCGNCDCEMVDCADE